MSPPSLGRRSRRRCFPRRRQSARAGPSPTASWRWGRTGSERGEERCGPSASRKPPRRHCSRWPPLRRSNPCQSKGVQKSRPRNMDGVGVHGVKVSGGGGGGSSSGSSSSSSSSSKQGWNTELRNLPDVVYKEAKGPLKTEKCDNYCCSSESTHRQSAWVHHLLAHRSLTLFCFTHSFSHPPASNFSTKSCRTQNKNAEITCELTRQRDGWPC